GAIFVDSNLNFTVKALPSVSTSFNTTNNTTIAGTPGTAGPGGTNGNPGSALGNSIFLRSGSSLKFLAQDVDDLLTLGSGVGFIDDTSFGAGGTNVYAKGDGTIIYNGTTDYAGAVTIQNANFKVNGAIDNAPITVDRDTGFSTQKGTLSGTGTLTGGVTAAAGIISADAGGTLTLGNLNLGSTSEIHSEIDSGGTSLVGVTGAAALAGTLELNVDSDATVGTYQILTSSGITGTFDSVSFTGITPAEYTLSYLPVGAPTYVQFNILRLAGSSGSGSGTLAGPSGQITFNLSATRNTQNEITASLFYNDPGAGVHFDNPVVTSLNFSGSQVTMSGTVNFQNSPVTFTAIATGGSPGSLSVTLSNGYSVTENLTSGEVSIQ
ncbi:hypothetical protein K2X33_14965, partial [bacterium]|nr:hypothetical protein [bacterium]